MTEHDDYIYLKHIADASALLQRTALLGKEKFLSDAEVPALLDGHTGALALVFVERTNLPASCCIRMTGHTGPIAPVFVERSS